MCQSNEDINSDKNLSEVILPFLESAQNHWGVGKFADAANIYEELTSSLGLEIVLKQSLIPEDQLLEYALICAEQSVLARVWQADDDSYKSAWYAASFLSMHLNDYLLVSQLFGHNPNYAKIYDQLFSKKLYAQASKVAALQIVNNSTKGNALGVRKGEVKFIVAQHAAFLQSSEYNETWNLLEGYSNRMIKKGVDLQDAHLIQEAVAFSASLLEQNIFDR